MEKFKRFTSKGTHHLCSFPSVNTFLDDMLDIDSDAPCPLYTDQFQPDICSTQYFCGYVCVCGFVLEIYIKNEEENNIMNTKMMKYWIQVNI